MGKAVCLVWSVWRLGLGKADQMAVSSVNYCYYYLSAGIGARETLALAQHDMGYTIAWLQYA